MTWQHRDQAGTALLLLGLACGVSERPGAADGGADIRMPTPVPDAGALPEPEEPRCGPDFGATDACGGSLEGSWTHREVCGSHPVVQLLEEACPGGTYSLASLEAQGELRVSGSTFEWIRTERFGVDAELAHECVREFGGCLGFERRLREVGAEASCAGSDACVCTISSAWQETRLAGELQIAGGEIILPTETGTKSFSYCVEGSALHLRDSPVTGPVYLLKRSHP